MRTKAIAILGLALLAGEFASAALARPGTQLRIVSAAPRVDLIHPGALKYLREAAILRQ